MADDTREPTGASPDETAPAADAPTAAQTSAARAAARPAAPEFEQLTLDPTLVGSGQRTEDPYEPGTKVKVDGQRGVFVYRYATLSKAGLVSLHLTQDGVFRAVRPDQVTPVKKRRSRW